MFIVLYRWRIKPEFEERFIDSWKAVTRYYLSDFGSLGSRLHRGSDGLWYGYAQWPTKQQRANASASSANDSLWMGMREAIEESFPEIELNLISDFLQSNPGK